MISKDGLLNSTNEMAAFERSSISFSLPIALEYRKDIDGLRALAVLSVIFYHLWDTVVPGGFIGVDVFFVISGYLITNNLIRDLNCGQFSLKTFYLRRIRRILPVLIIVLFVVCFIGYFILTPLDFKKLSNTSLAAILSVSNFYFWRHIVQGYFHTNSGILPLLHTWSLGIEEQFYVIWPITFVSLFTPPKSLWLSKKIHIIWNPTFIPFFFIGLSFFSYHYFSYRHGTVFYMPFSRAFELLIGASLSIHWTKLVFPSPKYSFLISMLGLSFIIYAMFYLTPKDYPSNYILLPCLGTALIIYSGGSSNQIVKKVLSSPPLRFIGLISYSLYLWHWPIIAYINYAGLEYNIKIRVYILISCFFISCLTWKYIETPFRKRYKFNIKKSILFFVIFPMSLMVALNITCRLIPEFGFNQIISSGIINIINNTHGPYIKSHCIDSATPAPLEQCYVGQLTKRDPSVLIVGDSHAYALAGMLNVLLKDAHLSGYLFTQSATPFIIQNNNPRNHLILTMIKSNRYTHVVFGGFWNYYPDSEFEKKAPTTEYTELSLRLEQAVQEVIKAGSIPVLIYDVPPLLRVRAHCGFTKVALSHCYNSDVEIKHYTIKTRQILLHLKHKYPSAILIDPAKVMCPMGKCLSAINKIPLYSTDGVNSHLNYAGSVLIGKRYLKQIKNPFLEL